MRLRDNDKQNLKHESDQAKFAYLPELETVYDNSSPYFREMSDQEIDMSRNAQQCGV